MRDSSFIEGSEPRSLSPQDIEESYEGDSVEREKEKRAFCYYNFIKNAFYISSSNESPRYDDFFSGALKPLFFECPDVFMRVNFDFKPLEGESRALLVERLNDPMKWVLVLMALGLTPEPYASKEIDDHVVRMNALCKARSFPVDACLTTDLQHAANKELLKFSSKTFAAFPYEILRAGIYFEIQRIEALIGSDSGAVQKAQNLREIMNDLNQCYDSSRTSLQNYGVLNTALGPARALYRELNAQRSSYGSLWDSLRGVAETRSLTNVLNLQQAIEEASLEARLSKVSVR